MEDAEFIQSVRLAISRNDGELLERCVDNFSSFCFKDPPVVSGMFSAEVFEFVVDRLYDRKFQEMPGSWHLLRLFETDWGRLSGDQKDRLLIPLEETFEGYADFMACFLVSEILGNYYSNERALESLIHLSSVKAETPRSMVPLGLEYLARNSLQSISRKAIGRLTEMITDQSTMVRREVEESLGKIARRGQSQMGGGTAGEC